MKFCLYLFTFDLNIKVKRNTVNSYIKFKKLYKKKLYILKLK